MRRLSIECTIALAALSLLACPELSRPVQGQVVDPCEGLQEWALFVNGEPADEFVARTRGNNERVQAFIAELGIDLDRRRLTQLLELIDRNPQTPIENLPNALQGIGGFTTTVLLKKLLPATVDDEEEERGAAIADEIVYGKIRDYIFVEETLSGHLSVDMCTERKQFVPLGGQSQRKYFHWDIEIPVGEFSVAKRQDPVDPSDPNQYNDPFPSVNLVLPAQATDPANPNSIWRRDLKYKLHARGERIEVRHIYYRELGGANLMRLPSGHQYYISTAESCIDLFTKDYPPATFGELVDNDYCLGRCEHPPIYNTGG